MIVKGVKKELQRRFEDLIETFLLNCFMLVAFLAGGQPRPFGLTDEMRSKLETTSSPEKRLIRYKKFIHKDSIRYLKEANRYWQLRHFVNN